MFTAYLRGLLILVFLSAFISRAESPAFEVPDGTVESFEVGKKLFSNRNHTILTVPPVLEGARFIKTAIEAQQLLVCTHPGTVYAITPAAHPANSLAEELRVHGFEQLPVETFQLFGNAPEDRALVFRKNISKGESLSTRKWIVLLALGDLRVTRPKREHNWHANQGELLYNGIRLPQVWPPRYFSPSSDEPMETPCLDNPPEVISVDIGRQLFIDDFLISKTDMVRTFHRAEKYEENPVFKPETPHEIKPDGVCYLGHGGVFYDPADRFVKMWYSAGELDGALAFAQSHDCFKWERPDLGLPAGGNLLLPHGGRTRGPHAGGDNCLWLDTLTTNRMERIKFLTQRDSHDPHWLATSADGRSWSEPVPAGLAGDYCSFFFNPFRNVWVYSVKRGGPRGRCRYYSESSRFLTEGAFNNSVYWCNADRLDEPDPDAKCAPQLYSLNAVAYESLMLGIFYIHLGPPNDVCSKGGYPKITELKLGFSRDGFHWERPDRRAFIPASRTEGTWDRAYLHSTAGVCLIDGDRLVFPYCAFSGIAPDGSRGIYNGAGIGLAMLRRDGFASMDAADEKCTLTTRPLVFNGKYLFVNIACPQGELRAEILDKDSRAIEPFSLDNSLPVSVDKTLVPLSWKGVDDLSSLAGHPIRIRFHLKKGSLYAFWISPFKTGESRGYLAAGALGHPGIIDIPE